MAQVEHLTLLLVVALAFVAAAIPLGALLFGQHEIIELVLSLPIP